MKIVARLILILAIIAQGVVAGPKECSAVHIDRTVSIAGEATVPLTPGPLLDDFSRGIALNTWRAVTSTFGSEPSASEPLQPEGFCDAGYTSNSSITFGGTGYSLELEYDVSNSYGEGASYLGSFAGYSSKLGGADLSTYKYLSFWVKGAVGGEYFKIELKNNVANDNRNHAAVYVTDYLDGGVTTAWQKVSIPFDAFANIVHWTSMKEFVIIFENYQSTTNGSSTSGIVYIDNISFGNLFLGYVRVDHFGDTWGICALGGDMNDWSYNGESAAHSYSDTIYQGSSYGLLSNYDVQLGTGAAGIYIKVGGGDDGVTGMPRDFTDYERLSLWIKAKSAGENPKAIVIEIKDTGTVHKWPVNEDTMTEISTSWQNYVLDIDITPGVDRENIKEITIVYAKNNWISGVNRGISNYGGDVVGGIYIDDIEFRDINYTGPDTIPPGKPTIPDVAGSGDIVIVSTTASAFNDDFYDNIEYVRFEFNDVGTWKAIGYDYDTADGTYSVEWDVASLPLGDYQVRAWAMDAAGNESAPSGETTYEKLNSPPSVGSVTPSSGSSNAGEEVFFSTTYTDPDGWQHLKHSSFMIDMTRDGINCFFGFYRRDTNKLYLMNEDGTVLLGRYAPGSENIIENDYAKLDCSKTTVSGSGDNMTVKWAVTFKGAFAGKTYNMHLTAMDMVGMTSGWYTKGTWEVK